MKEWKGNGNSHVIRNPKKAFLGDQRCVGVWGLYVGRSIQVSDELQIPPPIYKTVPPNEGDCDSGRVLSKEWPNILHAPVLNFLWL